MKEKEVQINLKWVLSVLPVNLIVIIIILAVTSSFEGVINGYVLGQMTNISFHNFANVGTFLLLVFTAYLITYVSAYLFLLTTQKAIQYLNEKLKYTFFTSDFYKQKDLNVSSSDVINKVTSISNQIQKQYFQPLFNLIQCLMTIISTTIVVLKTNLLLGLIYIILSLLSMVPNQIGKKRMNQKMDSWSECNSSLITVMKDIFQGKNEIRKFDVKNLFFRKFISTLSEEEERYFQLNRVQFSVQFCAWMCSISADVIPMGVGLLMVAYHLDGVEIGTIVTLSLTADHVLGGIREFSSYQTQITSTKNIRNIKIIQDDTDKAVKTTSQNQLSVNGISFARDKKLIFKHVNLQMKDRDKVIITGDSGVGKSTLLNIISGQLTPISGQVKFGQGSIALSDSVLISQKPWLFKGTIAENLSLYQSFSEKRLIKVLKEVHLWKELGAQPLNFEVESNGTNLSGGQAQRLVIARGLLRKKNLFLLDEITSSLDKENSTKIRTLIYQLPVMMIEVAHNIDFNLVKKYKIKIYTLTKDGIINERHLEN
ncbi:ABC transporter ATP-binding protein [Lactobacillus johnsonii]|jgi:ATP-binding cassette subfamily B protein|uniref:ATP-binding cassette domain-containing protein n=1 Tax=Lactobacillus johnsonii TaxID=33959 RepID=UPI00107164D9|nr:ABC transporter ATP-binding protein [Lactobacillus johnsonii]MBF0772202.1 ABC transporter ATP-binding protein [Lactobacillus johnsonii]MCF1583764.1 ABC transporter ATP-binding protein/permease [Lactobacillus johnsonii]MCI9451964.1 ABC transporter ATP-binding protein [Lactobacillus johnsonii]MDG4987875.1 ABC transporter ATP-binding protein [Lactobacillus johnsonii]NDO44550.1 ABC transporter ATP-binding protein [Lactobacillus johnsonii]